MKKLIKLEVMVAVLFSSAIAGAASREPGRRITKPSRFEAVKGPHGTLFIEHSGPVEFDEPLGFGPVDRELSNAAIDGDINSVKRLVNSGANINHRVYFGNTPLMLAIINASKEPDKYMEVISYLLEEGADYQIIKNQYLETALDLSMKNKGSVYKEIADLIRKKHREMQNEKILLMKAARTKNPESPFYYRKLPKDVFNEIIKQYLEETELE